MSPTTRVKMNVSISEIYNFLGNTWFSKFAESLNIPILNNKLICRYPWNSTKKTTPKMNTFLVLKICLNAVLSLPTGLAYLVYQQLLMTRISKVKEINEKDIFISSIIYQNEYQENITSENFFWGPLKNLSIDLNRSTCYVLVPYKRIRIEETKTSQNYKTVDLRSCRSSFFLTRACITLLAANVFYISVIFKLFFKPRTIKEIRELILEEHQLILGRELSSTVFIEMLMTDFSKLIFNTKIFFTCEGQQWEISMLQQISVHNDIYAVVHVPLRAENSQINVYGIIDAFSKPLNLKFLTPGENSKKLLSTVIKEKYPIFNVEAQRFIKGSQVQKGLPIKKTDQFISVFLSADYEYDEDLLKMLIESFPEILGDHIYVYPHPSDRKILDKKKIPKFMTVSETYIPTHINLFSLSTSTFLNKIFFGSLIAIYQPVIGFSPLGDLNHELYFNNKESLIELIKRNYIFQQNDIVTVVNTNENLKLWQKILSE
jgi:hypothetical protein